MLDARIALMRCLVEFHWGLLKEQAMGAYKGPVNGERVGPLALGPFFDEEKMGRRSLLDTTSVPLSAAVHQSCGSGHGQGLCLLTAQPDRLAAGVRCRNSNRCLHQRRLRSVPRCADTTRARLRPSHQSRQSKFQILILKRARSLVPRTFNLQDTFREILMSNQEGCHRSGHVRFDCQRSMMPNTRVAMTGSMDRA